MLSVFGSCLILIKISIDVHVHPLSGNFADVTHEYISFRFKTVTVPKTPKHKFDNSLGDEKYSSTLHYVMRLSNSMRGVLSCGSPRA